MKKHTKEHKKKISESLKKAYKDGKRDVNLFRGENNPRWSGGEWKKNPKKYYNKKARELYRKRRLKVLEHYSGSSPKCACCGESIYEFLVIDHINGDGNKHRKEIGRGGYSLYGWLIKNNFPKGFQVLCHNCNAAKGHYGECPHNKQ